MEAQALELDFPRANTDCVTDQPYVLGQKCKVECHRLLGKLNELIYLTYLELL